MLHFKIKKRITTFQIIILSFASVILLGSLLLMLPAATADRMGASFKDALFTSTSAVCVTGLVVRDTATYWSLFGQLIIMLLIQIGGLGVVTVAAFIAMISGKRIGLLQRSTMQEAIAAPSLGGIVRLTGFIFRTSLSIELIGAAAMAPVFCRDFGPLKGLWFSIFHSVSAFCNAGFDLMGNFSSLMAYMDQPVINLTVMLLIIAGGIGFLTWNDIRTKGIHIHRYRMQSKVIFVVTALLIVLPALYFYVVELRGMPAHERIWSSLFQAVTPRTAGFNTTNLSLMSDTGLMLMILLMLIGGSPGSTAGGMKTTTFAVLLASSSAVFGRRENGRLFRRRILDETVKYASTVALMYIVLCVAGAMIISAVENLPILTCLFETASAIGTVGLTLGITPGLSLTSRLILIVLMFMGRVGGLTLVFAALPGNWHPHVSKLPVEKIIVG